MDVFIITNKGIKKLSKEEIEKAGKK